MKGTGIGTIVKNPSSFASTTIKAQRSELVSSLDPAETAIGEAIFGNPIYVLGFQRRRILLLLASVSIPVLVALAFLVAPT